MCVPGCTEEHGVRCEEAEGGGCSILARALEGRQQTLAFQIFPLLPTQPSDSPAQVPNPLVVLGPGQMALGVTIKPWL